MIRGAHNHSYTLLPCLASKMRAAGATNEALAKVTGVSTPTVDNARRGKRVHAHLGVAMYQALNTLKFKRCPQGGKG